MNNPEFILRTLDARLAKPTQLILYGRAALALGYLVLKELGRRWAALDVTVEEGLKRLNTYCAVEVAGVIQVMLEPREDVRTLLDAAGVKLPASVVRSASRVATKKKLPKNRPTRMK